MPFSGFGQESGYGTELYGFSNWAKIHLLDYLPEVYKDEDKKTGFLFAKFLRGLTNTHNEFRTKLDFFPNIRDAEEQPNDSIVFSGVIFQNSTQINIVTTLPSTAVVGDTVKVLATNTDPQFVAPITSINTNERYFQLSTTYPFTTGIKDVEVKGTIFKFLVTSGSDRIIAVPEEFPDIKAGDFLTGNSIVTDNRIKVNIVNKDLSNIQVFPVPTGTTGFREIIRESRFPMLTLLAKDIGLFDDTAKIKELRTGNVLNAILWYKTKGTEKSYIIRGALEGLEVTLIRLFALACGDPTLKAEDDPTFFLTFLTGTYDIDFDSAPLDYLNPDKYSQYEESGRILSGLYTFAASTTITGGAGTKILELAVGQKIRRLADNDNTKFAKIKNISGSDGSITITLVSAYTGTPASNVTAISTCASDFFGTTDALPATLAGTYSFTANLTTAMGGTGSILRQTPASLVLQELSGKYTFTKDSDIVQAGSGTSIIEVIIGEKIKLSTDSDSTLNTILAKNGVSGNFTITLANPYKGLGGIGTAHMRIFTGVGRRIRKQILPVNPQVPADVVKYRKMLKAVGKDGSITITLEKPASAGESGTCEINPMSVCPIPQIFTVKFIGVSREFEVIGNLPPPDSSTAPTLVPGKDFIKVGATDPFDYKVLTYNATTKKGLVDTVLRDISLANTNTTAFRLRKKDITRKFFTQCPTTRLKLKLAPSPGKAVFIDAPSTTEFINRVIEVKPIHVIIQEFEIIFDTLTPISIPITVSMELHIDYETTINVNNYMEVVPADSVPLDGGIQVFYDIP